MHDYHVNNFEAPAGWLGSTPSRVFTQKTGNNHRPQLFRSGVLYGYFYCKLEVAGFDACLPDQQ